MFYGYRCQEGVGYDIFYILMEKHHSPRIFLARRCIDTMLRNNAAMGVSFNGYPMVMLTEVYTEAGSAAVL